MTPFPTILAPGRRRPIAVVILTGLMQAAAVAMAVIATRYIFAAISDPARTMPVEALGALALSGLAIALLRIAQASVGEHLGQSFAGDLRERLFAHLGRTPRDVIRAQRRGGLSLRFVGDLSAVRGWVGKALPRLVSASLVLPGACLAGYLLEPRLGIALTVPLIIGLSVMALASRRLKPAHSRLRQRQARLSADMSERVPYAPELRLIGRLGREQSRLRQRTRALTAAAVVRTRSAEVMRCIPDVVSATTATAVLSVALTEGMSSAAAAGALAATSLMIRPLRDVASIWDRYSAFSVARSKCVRLMTQPTLPDERKRPKRCRLTFDRVAHGPLQDVSFSLPSGKSMIVSGPNGSGKSTLLALAAGLQCPISGHVLVGRTDAARLAARAGIQLLDIDSPILAGSFRRVLTLGLRRRPDDAMVLNTAIAYGLGPAIDRLGGLQGRVAERAGNLSAGERWRVLLARASLANSRVILLDCPDRVLDADALDLIRDLMVRKDLTIMVTSNDPDVDLPATHHLRL